MQQRAPTVSDIRSSAISLLALREHSAKELRDKLARKFAAAELVDEAITGLIELNLQSDKRFAKAFTAMRQRQGKGPVIIKIELRQKGIAAELIDRYVNENDPVWLECAGDVWRKKFHTTIPVDAHERAKQIRFLHSRGFSSHHIQTIFTTSIGND